MWICAPNNVDLSVIVWNLRGNTQLWTKQLAQQAWNVAKLSTVQNVALAKNSREEAGERQEANWNKGYRCPVQIHYILSPKCTLTTSARESIITITMQTLSEFIKAQAKHLTWLDNSFDANSWGQRQWEHEEQLTTTNLEDVSCCKTLHGGFIIEALFSEELVII